MTPLRHRILVLALLCGSLTAFACSSSSSPVVCNGGCLCVTDEQTCRSYGGGCSWTGSYCSNEVVSPDSGADAADAAASDDAESEEAESGAH